LPLQSLLPFPLFSIRHAGKPD